MATLSPDAVTLAPGAAAVNENIEHLYLICEERDKPDVLRKLLHAFEIPRSIVFVHRNEVAERVAAKLAHHKLAVADLSAELNKMDRKQAMDGIRSGAIRIMIATDLAARGLDIPGVTHVFNLDVPTTSKAYLHRVGRTGRAGAKGIADLAAHGDRGPARAPLRAGARHRHAACASSGWRCLAAAAAAAAEFNRDDGGVCV